MKVISKPCLRVLSATVTRRTRSGDILGPHQRVGVMTALKAMTIWPAWQHFAEDDNGSIEVGKLPGFVILSEDPTAVDPDTLADVQVLGTINEVCVVYQAAVGERKGELGWRMFAADPDMAHESLHGMYDGMGNGTGAHHH